MDSSYDLHDQKNDHMIDENNHQLAALPIKVVWKHGGEKVYITGTFDAWSKMKKESDGTFVTWLTTSTNPLLYKFVVDGVWQHDMDQPIEKDLDGNINNILVINNSDQQ
ncbi:immunoglobulin E-set [Halteromyces radiatus]|uniref:immunoglobulin E-set n=1 Tax=Halteromyces radiatus TaxID=101107 RepID=UPI0022208607|nr:immunoglobulin E-set [Halteromyces radiatus]KAI8076827.1 immunoglobulin E-set [Halteromyces radiatus]